MKAMKKLIALLLACSMLLALAACGSSSSSSSSSSTSEEATATEEAATTEESTEAAASTEEAEAVSTSSDGPVHGGSATFYYPKFYNYFDAAAKNQLAYMLWFDTLFMIDWGLNDADICDYTSAYLTYDQCTGQVADTWVIADDWSYIEITIHDNVYFQEKEGEYNIFNGRQMTAEDVAYTFNRLLGLNGVEMVECETDWTSELYMVEGVEVIDELTVRITFNTNTENGVNDFIVECVTGVALTGPEWDELTSEQQNDWHYAIGTGPYILTEYVADNYMTFEANPNYFGVDERYGEQLPYIDEVTLVYIADGDNILTQFLAGELDWFGGEKSGLLTDSQIAQLKATMSADSYTEYFYSSGSPEGIGLNITAEPFSDINVRIAMQMAINIEEIWTSYYGEEAELVICGLWSTEMGNWATAGNWDEATLAEYTYNPEAAIELLAEAGYPDGFSFEMVMDPLADADLFVLMQSYLAAIGIDMTINPISEVMEHNAIVTDSSDGRAFNNFAGNFSSTSDVFGMTVTGGFGFGYFHNNAEYDALYQELTSATDLTTAANAAYAMDEIYVAEHWIITSGCATTCSEFMSGRIGGFTGENIYNNNCMHVIFARLWVTD